MTSLAAQVAGLPQRLVARVSKLPPRRQERIQDLGLGVALAAVTLSYEPGYITVSVTDSGKRQNPGRRAARRQDAPPPDGNCSAAARPGPLLAGTGLGLAGIAERVASCGGHLTVGPTPADGFGVTARLPAL